MTRYPPDLLTAVELAAFLYVTPSAVRHMARQHHIQPVGKVGRAHLYDARAFVDTVGGHDRSAGRKRRSAAKLTDEGGDTCAQRVTRRGGNLPGRGSTD